MMNNIVGQPVESDDFFNRETDVNAVWESLEQGNHVLLLFAMSWRPVFKNLLKRLTCSRQYWVFSSATAT